MGEAYRDVGNDYSRGTSNVPMGARRTTMRNAVTCVVGLLLLLVGCGDAPGTAASTGSSTNSPPATRQGPPTRQADLVGAITAVTPFEPVTERCTLDALVVDPLAGLPQLQVDHADAVTSMTLRQSHDPG